MNSDTDVPPRSISRQSSPMLSIGRNCLVSRGLQALAQLPPTSPAVLLDNIHTAASNGDADLQVLDDANDDATATILRRHGAVGKLSLEGIKKLKDTAGSDIPMNEEMARGLGMMARGAIQSGVTEFADFIRMVAQSIGIDLTRKYGVAIEAGWNRIKDRGAPIEAATSTIEALKEIEDERRGQTDGNGDDAPGVHGDRHVEDDQADGDEEAEGRGETGGSGRVDGVPDRGTGGESLEGGNGRDGSPVGSGEAATSHSGQTLDRLRGKRCAAVDPNVLEIRGD